VAERTNPFGQPIGAPVEGWSARLPPARTRTVGRYCVLEPVQCAKHAEDLFAAYREAQDDRDWTYLSIERPVTLEQLREYLARLERTDDPLHFTILDAKTQIALGTLALMRIDPAAGVIEIGSITFSPRLKRTRASTESIYLLMRRAFDELGYRRFEWKCDSLNSPSRRAATRYGFVFEGIFRQATVYKGRNRDTAWYSVIDREWPLVRAAFEAWLADDNFASDGQQKRRLGECRDEIAAARPLAATSFSPQR